MKERVPFPAMAGLQKIPNQENLALGDTQSRRLRTRACVCRLEYPNGQPIGTGFLVGPNLLLTCYHVLKGVQDLAGVVLRFDYRMNELLQVETTREYGLSNDQTRLSFSDVDPNDEKPDSLLDTDRNNLDYRLLRIEGNPAYDQIAGTVERPLLRGWIDPPPDNYKVEIGEPLDILHHPFGATLTESNVRHSVFHITSGPGRIRHRTPTLPGSSGSPCFDVNMQWVAMHQRGEDREKGFLWNSAIPATAICAHIKSLSSLRTRKYTPPPFAIKLRRPKFIDFRPLWAPMKLPDDGLWKNEALIVTIPIQISLREAPKPIKLGGITAFVNAFPRGRSYRWAWKANVSTFGKGWLGQYEAAAPQSLEPLSNLTFEAQFKPSSNGDIFSWRDFHDFILGGNFGKLELVIRFEFEALHLDMPVELSVSEMRALFAEGDENDFHFTRFLQPNTL
ncbi:serine protease [Mesorhizobium sp. Cs1299R1N1]|uniref:trypsin-like serine peptidase n=1 Tax=Mesorhizobium sp. Cs1299R1N1 TaxID=3015172 RepID=UPI00301C0C4A